MAKRLDKTEVTTAAETVDLLVQGASFRRV